MDNTSLAAPVTQTRSGDILEKASQIQVRLSSHVADLRAFCSRLGIDYEDSPSEVKNDAAPGFLTELDLLLARMYDDCDDINSVIRALLTVV